MFLLMRLALLLAIPFIILVNPASVPAQADGPGNCEETPFDKGRLWKITKGDTKPSYIFGTMHSRDPRILQLPPIVMQAFNQSLITMFEIARSNENITATRNFLLLPQNESLKSKIGEERFERLSNLVMAYGVPPHRLNQLKIWAVAVLISRPASAGPHQGESRINMLDRDLKEIARQSGKQVIGLETTIEQMSVFDDAPTELQIEFLDQALAEHKNLEDESEILTRYYLKGNIGWIACKLEQDLQSSSAELKRFMSEKILDERNKKMVDRMTALLDQGGVFVGIGALHLPGETGILSLLQERGFSIERNY